MLDFDGPVCQIFAEYSARTIVSEICTMLRLRGIRVPPELAESSDPLAVLRWIGGLADGDLLEKTEDTLRAAEVRAAHQARPTPYAHELLRAAHAGGVPVVIVSNNSAEAINAYLCDHGLGPLVTGTLGRPYGAPDQMKPNPALLLQAVAQFGGVPSDYAMVGDSVSDIEAAVAAGVYSIGYANRPGKLLRLTAAKADVVITSIEAVSISLASVAGQRQ